MPGVGQPHYLVAATGLFVFSSAILADRVYCFANGCGHDRVTDEDAAAAG